MSLRMKQQRALQKGPKFVLRKPTLRAREEFFKLEKQYEYIFEKARISPKFLLEVFSSEELERLANLTDEEANKMIVEKIREKPELLKEFAKTLTADEEIEYTKGLFELAKACIDWSESTGTPEDLLDEPIETVVGLINSFRSRSRGG